MTSQVASEKIGVLARIAPGLPPLLHYNFRADFRHDLMAGLSVAAVALPVAVAYAQLAGFNPVVGLYSEELEERTFPTMRQALRAYRRQTRPTAGAPMAEE